MNSGKVGIGGYVGSGPYVGIGGMLTPGDSLGPGDGSGEVVGLDMDGSKLGVCHSSEPGG